MKFLVTGCAGFIGMHVVSKLCQNQNYEILGIDNFNSYYDVQLKRSRSSELEAFPNFALKELDILDRENLIKSTLDFKPDYIIHLAAQAGVRYSITNPDAYISSNIQGFMNILEASKESKVKHLVYASSSSVYGGNKTYPFKETNSVDHPVSLYAATKKSNELMAHVYSHLHQIPTTGLRFFTVYGPWGRPDMALFIFADAIFKNKPIKVFNHGKMTRDFTFIDDISEAISRIVLKIPTSTLQSNPQLGESWAPYKVFNIGNSKPVELIEYINILEKKIGIQARKSYLEMQPGDVVKTHSDTSSLENWIQFQPSTPIEVGIDKFVDWYKKYYQIK